MPKTAKPWSAGPACARKLIKIGAKVVSHGRYVTFQLAEVAVSRQMFADILSLIARLPPAASTGMSGAGVESDRRQWESGALMKAKPLTLTLAGRKHIASAADNVRLPTKRIAPMEPQQADCGPSDLGTRGMSDNMSFIKQIAFAALGATMLLGSGLIASPAGAGYVVTLAEVGSDVVATGSGPIDLTGLSFAGNGDATAIIVPEFGVIGTGPAGIGLITQGLSAPDRRVSGSAGGLVPTAAVETEWALSP